MRFSSHAQDDWPIAWDWIEFSSLALWIFPSQVLVVLVVLVALVVLVVPLLWFHLAWHWTCSWIDTMLPISPVAAWAHVFVPCAQSPLQIAETIKSPNASPNHWGLLVAAHYWQPTKSKPLTVPCRKCLPSGLGQYDIIPQVVLLWQIHKLHPAENSESLALKNRLWPIDCDDELRYLLQRHPAHLQHPLYCWYVYPYHLDHHQWPGEKHARMWG